MRVLSGQIEDKVFPTAAYVSPPWCDEVVANKIQLERYEKNQKL